MIERYILLALFPAITAHGFSDFTNTPQETAMCQAAIYDGHDISDRRNWGHMHHFCDCIRFTNRAMSLHGNSRDFEFELGRAIDGCDYVLRQCEPGFYMLGEVHLQKGKALKLAGKDSLAAAEFIKALSINPDLVNAYTALSDFNDRIGRREEALKIISKGLQHVPDSKSLQRRYTKLGGKLPYPEPLKQQKPTMSPSPDMVPPVSKNDPKIDKTQAQEQGNKEILPDNDILATQKQLPPLQNWVAKRAPPPPQILGAGFVHSVVTNTGSARMLIPFQLRNKSLIVYFFIMASMVMG